MTTLVGHATVCDGPNCVGDVDPENHASNPTTGEVFCSAECWADGFFGGDSA